MTNWARSIVITVLLLVLAAGGYMAWNDQPGGQMAAASRFEQRSRNLPDARRISLLYPGSVALVGASDDTKKTGGRPQQFLRRAGFAVAAATTCAVPSVSTATFLRVESASTAAD